MKPKKQPVKTKKKTTRKKCLSIKEIIVDKQELIITGCSGTWKGSQIDWTVCEISTMCGHKDYILGICNTWIEIIHIKNTLLTTQLFLVLVFQFFFFFFLTLEFVNFCLSQCAPSSSEKETL